MTAGSDFRGTGPQIGNGASTTSSAPSKQTATGVDRMPQKTFPAGLLSGQDVNDNHEPLNLGQGEMRML
jgi:hypothetical protein